MNRIGLALLLGLAVCQIAFSQQGQPASQPVAPALRPEQLVDEWFIRVNALDDWFISLDGKEQPEEVVDRVADLYTPDAIQFVGPNENQLGSVTLSGKLAIHKWADDIARNCRDLAWRLISRTFEEKTASLFAVRPAWGGASVAAELTFSYTERDSGRRFMVPGAIFMDYKEDGKVRRLRLYLARDEAEEIFPYTVFGNQTQ